MVGTNRLRTWNLSRMRDELVRPHMPSPTELPPLHFGMGYRGTLKNLKIGDNEESK